MEPSLQPLNGESLSLYIANCDAGACLDIKASGFGGCWFQPTFFDVRIFNPHAPSNCSNPYHQHENIKRLKREFERLNTVTLILLFFQLQVVWVPLPL